MKDLFVKDTKKLKSGASVKLLGWVTRLNDLKDFIFLDLTDSTGTIQIVINKKKLKNNLNVIKKLALESSIQVTGLKKTRKKKIEIITSEIIVLSTPSAKYYPNPRGNFDIFSEKFNELLNEKRHIYIRSPKMIHILKMRHFTTDNIRQWFNSNKFIELTAPILTPTILYAEDTALKIKINHHNAFLTQCVGFYLEASVHALERVYNIGPSFRGQESHTKRHLMEYWHVKAEIAFADLEDIISSVEKLIYYLCKNSKKYDDENQKILGLKICLDGLKIPYPRITYENAIKYLNKKGMKIKFGEHLGSKGELILSNKFKNTPFWIIGNPRTLEPFPYSLDPKDNRILKVADLIASKGYGEILGVAEKISDIDMLSERMKEKGKHNDKSYKWVYELHEFGSVPHAAMGMGLERIIRWLFNIPHVKYTIPFPRTFRTKIYP